MELKYVLVVLREIMENDGAKERWADGRIIIDFRLLPKVADEIERFV